MNERKSKNIVIIALCITLIFMGVGFSALSQTLKIDGTATVSGTWNVHIDSIEATEAVLEGATVDAAGLTALAGTVDTNGTLATFDVDLPNPADYVIYKVTVKNTGSIAATLTSLQDTLASDTDYEYIDFEVSQSEDETTSLAAESGIHTFIVKASYDKDFVGANTPEIPEGGATEKILVTMQYEQA